MMKFLTILLLLGFFSLQAKENDQKNTTNKQAQDSTTLHFDFPQLDVIGVKERLTDKIPGSASLVSREDIIALQPISGNEIISKMSGVNVVDEEGAGLRLNLGVRGLDPDRSRTLLVLEDGVPVALAPYGEPEMYYTPAIERMSGIELLKGSGSILWGPQTIGGVLNYKTMDPPVESASQINLRGGTSGLLSFYGSYGTNFDGAGMQVGYLHKQADRIAITSMQVNDLTAKLKFQINGKSQIGIKFSFYNEESNATYLGITQSMYNAGEYFTIMAPNDKLDIRRYAASINHQYIPDETSFLKTNLFAYTTARNWLRQDFSRSKTANAVAVYGDTSMANGAVYMRNSTGNRNRQFEVIGLESRFNKCFNIAEMNNEVEAGIRFLYEKAYEQRINGKKYNAVSGELTEDEIRSGSAVSLFIQNKLNVTPDFIITPGVRLESFTFERNIHRISSRDTSLQGEDDLFTVIPGMGANYKVNTALSLFAGVHKGYAPPRVKDAISNAGTSLQLDAEQSINSELGLRWNSSALEFEMTYYRMDFSNQIIPISESSGGLGTGFVNGGKTKHSGFEFAISHKIENLFDKILSINNSFNITYSQALYNSDRMVVQNENKINVKGNKLPYSPEVVSNLNISLLFMQKFSLLFHLIYTTEQFGDELNTRTPDPSGEKGIIPAHTLVNMTARYTLSQIGSSFYISVKNASDLRYIAGRRPQGIKVGVPRMIVAGIETSL